MSLVPQPSETPPTASESLAQTLVIGNTTLARDIIVSNPQKVAYAGNIVLQNNTGGGGTDVIVNSIPLNGGAPLTQSVFVDTATNKLYRQTQTNETLAQTLAIGNSTGANDIVVASPQKISYAGDINLQNGAGSDVIINSIPVAPSFQQYELCYDNTAKKVYFQTPATFTAGAGVSFSGPPSSQTIANTGLLGLTSANAGTNIAITGTATNPIITATSGPSTIGVRFNSIQTLSLPALTDTGYNPFTFFTIALPPAFSGCNVFTIYIRSIAFVATTFSVNPISFKMYISDQFGSATTGAYDSNEGALSSYEWTGVINGQGYGASSLVWNYRPSVLSGNLYFNGFLTSSTQSLGTNGLQVILDIVGQTMTLV